MTCLEESDEVLIVATSLKDVFYFAAKSAEADAGYRAVELIFDLATLAQVDAIVCKNAILLKQSDYEDGIVAACAFAEGADAIITRDEGSFTELGVPRFTLDEFIAHRGFEAISV